MRLVFMQKSKSAKPKVRPAKKTTTTPKTTAKTRYKNSTQYKAFLQSSYWKATRKLALARDGYKCQKCGNTKTLQVHHKTYEHIGSEHLHFRDIVTLCRTCHNQADKKRRTESRANQQTKTKGKLTTKRSPTT